MSLNGREKIADSSLDNSVRHLHRDGHDIQLLWLNDSGKPLIQTEKASLSAKERIKQPVGSPSASLFNARPQPENDNGIQWAALIVVLGSSRMC